MRAVFEALPKEAFEEAREARCAVVSDTRATTTIRARNKRRATYFSTLKEFFNRSQFFCARSGCSGEPHAQDPARGSNTRCNFIEAEIGVFNELSESATSTLSLAASPSMSRSPKAINRGKSGGMSG